ncbi:class I SAM-dependent methyltransferase [Sphingosinicella rhizophila]|uniref:Class I SAM-dependent methyltransferase n=1 Tax=Sphingosinicella rhizophila TaxID=3050082 RepID=A0ABU3Q8P1_9SPHN|nr:class I SAM-dependent methyltransferase [Sphingosinicella sp. GR2756]MDT9599305.1 class I SAM-dependent methyltransferase [Sphingosinicella sp. GR2756]
MPEADAGFSSVARKSFENRRKQGPHVNGFVADADRIAAVYGRWAPIYDLMFGPVFRLGRNAAVDAAEKVGGRVLEVGVGTGLSLPSYSDACRIHGVDISVPMLEKARRRVDRLGLSNIDAVEVMDAERLAYADDFFDVVVAQYVVTAVPNPERALDEFARVVRPGGEIIITTRIGAERGMRGAIEKGLMPLTGRLGWRTEFPWSRYLGWANGKPSIQLEERRPLPPFGHFFLLRFVKVEAATGPTLELVNEVD